MTVMMPVVSNHDLWTRIQAAGLTLLKDNNSPRWQMVVVTMQGMEKRDKTYMCIQFYLEKSL